MKYKKLGNSSFEVSVIGQGTWAMGGDTFGDVDVGEAIRTIHAGMDMGINFIDTAAGYVAWYLYRLSFNRIAPFCSFG